MSTSLDDVLNGTPEPTPASAIEAAPEPTPEPAMGEQAPEPEAKPGQPRDETGKFAPKPKDEAAAAPPAAQPEPAHVPRKALEDERRKRQELERQLAAFQQPQATQQPPQAPQQPPKPGLFEDPDGWERSLEERVQSRVQDERLNWSEMIARQAHPDMDEAFETYKAAVAQNPALHQQVLANPHPWEAMYQVAQRLKVVQEIGDPVTYRDRLREELRKELEAEMAAKPPAQPAVQLPQSLAKATATGGRTPPQWSGPAPLSALGNPALR